MKIDLYGQHIYSEDDISDLYLTDPSRVIKEITVEQPIEISDILDLQKIPKFVTYVDPAVNLSKFDVTQQEHWFLPEEYKNFDIAKYVIDLCKNDEELQRVAKELLLFQERGMFPLLIYLKYLVDTMRKNNIVWGVGRGSSVASYVLFLIGVHRINSIFYDLSIDEFLR